MTALQKAESIRARKGERPIAVLTAYDYPTARLLDESGVDVLLVGDSLGMVVLGFPDTTHVTLDHMLHHVAAVARAQPRALVVGDLPIHTYDTPSQVLFPQPIPMVGTVRDAESSRAVSGTIDSKTMAKTPASMMACAPSRMASVCSGVLPFLR